MLRASAKSVSMLPSAALNSLGALRASSDDRNVLFGAVGHLPYPLSKSHSLVTSATPYAVGCCYVKVMRFASDGQSPLQRHSSQSRLFNRDPHNEDSGTLSNRRCEP